VVPGISSAVAAAGLAGIPVTHRGLASGFLVVSGHAEGAYRPILESVAPHSVTVVVMMGLGGIAGVASTLVARGWSPLTPAAVMLGASTAESDAWTLTLGELQRGLRDQDDGVPGTVVIGEVVRLHAALMPGRVADGEAAAR